MPAVPLVAVSSPSLLSVVAVPSSSHLLVVTLLPGSAQMLRPPRSTHGSIAPARGDLSVLRLYWALPLSPLSQVAIPIDCPRLLSRA